MLTSKDIERFQTLLCFMVLAQACSHSKDVAAKLVYVCTAKMSVEFTVHVK